MLIKCQRCRTYNVVSTARLAEEPREALAMVHNRLRGLYIKTSRIVSLAVGQQLGIGDDR